MVKRKVVTPDKPLDQLCESAARSFIEFAEFAPDAKSARDFAIAAAVMLDKLALLRGDPRYCSHRNGPPCVCGEPGV